MKKGKQKKLCVWGLMMVGVIGMGSLLYFHPSKGITAESPKIKIGIIQPLSGALSRNGNLGIQGTKAMVDWINGRGGIKSLGGAKIELVIADSGSAAESATSAMERLCKENIVLVTDGWASSLCMATTEISERLGIPQFNISYSDLLTQRGYKWGFYLSPPSSAQGRIGLKHTVNLARSAGQEVKTVMLVGDNQAASKGFYDACRKILPEMDIKIIGEEIWSMGTLTDATAVIQKVKTLNPDLVMFMGTAIAEAQMSLMKKKEFGIEIPFVCNGGWAADPSFLQAGAATLEGMITFNPYFPHKLTPKEWIDITLEQCRKEYSNEPFVGQELAQPWALYPLIVEILERAGSTNKQTIWEAAHKLDINNVLAVRGLAGQGMAFDATGRVVEKYQNVQFVQWQGGLPYTVYPEDLAVRRPIWKFKKK